MPIKWHNCYLNKLSKRYTLKLSIIFPNKHWNIQLWHCFRKQTSVHHHLIMFKTLWITCESHLATNMYPLRLIFIWWTFSGQIKSTMSWSLLGNRFSWRLLLFWRNVVSVMSLYVESSVVHDIRVYGVQFCVTDSTTLI